MKKVKELNLSERIVRKGELWGEDFEFPEDMFWAKDVKEFIHQVREGPKKNTALTIENLHKWVDKLAGPKLVGDLK